jgi:dipeptidyl aminopeptidase/acylaminoacyl peptidase
MRKLHALVAFIAFLLPSISYADTAKQPITHETLWMMKRVSSPVVSPDGRLVVFSITEPSYDDKELVADLWMVPADGSARLRRLTASKGGESDVAWSPDSRRIAFSAKREGDETNQIYLLDVAGGGEAQRVTSVSTGAGKPQFRPDGNAILFAGSVYPGALDDAANKKIAGERKDKKSKVRIYDSFPIRRWDRWLDDMQTHLFVQSLESGAKAKDLLAGTQLVAGPGFVGRGGEGSRDDLEAVWSPDGQSIVFSATAKGNESAWSTVGTNLYQIAAGGGEPRQLNGDNRSYGRPKFRPDGKALYFNVSDDANKIYALDRIGMAAWPPAGPAFGATTLVTASFDRSVSNFDFTPDSQTVLLTAEDSGQEKIYAVPARGGETKLAVSPERGVYGSLNVAAGSPSPVVIGLWSSAINPAEVVRIDVAARTHKLLTDVNVAKAAAIDWLPLRHFWFKNSRGRQIHNMIALPPGFDPAKKYPLLVLIHGGAANMWRDQITLRWNYHLLAVPGYVLLLTDYTGSTGYGEAFTQALLGDPLKGPGLDLNEAADEAIKRFPFIDGSRQAAAGASYGGHLANWLEATTTRYKCLIAHAGLMNLEAQWGTSDGIFHRELTAGGPPWEQSAVWREQNPIRYAASFKTPMLLSVGENDFRVPINNTLEAWSALQRMRVPSRLLVWPGENHWVLNPENSRVFYREVADWLEKWLK